MNFIFEFPIHTQTSDTDKLVLLEIRNFLHNLGEYNFLEIGSFLGGSLTPFLKDEKCIRILSVDDRGRCQPDERGVNYDYSGITNETMIDELHRVGLNTEKLQTFDGSIDEFTLGSEKYDFIFIDGEHTDFACFRDFVHSEKLLKTNSIVAFHDAPLIYKSVVTIVEMLKARNSIFNFIKVKNSNMFLLTFNEFSKILENFSSEEDLSLCYKEYEDQLLLNLAKNKFQFETVIKIKETPTEKGY